MNACPDFCLQGLALVCDPPEPLLTEASCCYTDSMEAIMVSMMFQDTVSTNHLLTSLTIEVQLCCWVFWTLKDLLDSQIFCQMIGWLSWERKFIPFLVWLLTHATKKSTSTTVACWFMFLVFYTLGISWRGRLVEDVDIEKVAKEKCSLQAGDSFLGQVGWQQLELSTTCSCEGWHVTCSKHFSQ